MRICTITCHKVYNYGACLQAYALQKYLQSQGHDVKIIDYVPEGTNSQFDFWYISPTSKYYHLCKRFKVLNWLFAVINSYRINISTKRNAAFENFQQRYYNLTCRFQNIEELKKNPPVADVYVAGSDQIWNPLVNNGKDKCFYLDFGENSTKRISYAASFSVPLKYFTTVHISFIRPLLKRFNKLSVRESSGIEILKAIGFDGLQVLDPVFLLTREEWRSMIPDERPIRDKYILVYHLFAESEGLVEFAKKEASQRNLKIVAINDRCRRNYAEIQINDAGPIEFISLIANAEMVIADSFHATAFSIIFNIDFHVFYSLPNIARMKDLVNSLGIDNRINSQEYDSIEWDVVNEKIKHYQGICFDFLKFHSPEYDNI